MIRRSIISRVAALAVVLAPTLALAADSPANNAKNCGCECARRANQNAEASAPAEKPSMLGRGPSDSKPIYRALSAANRHVHQ